MDDNLISMTKESSKNNTQFKLWDKGQPIIIFSRTKIDKHTNFVGDKNDTLITLK